MISEEFRKRKAINYILASRAVGFYRLCGKDLQKKYRTANMTHNNPDREALLQEIISIYEKAIDEKQPPMDEKEKKHKLKLIRKIANKKF